MPTSPQYFGEFGTDQYLREHFFPDQSHGVMVEVGAATPEFLSLSQHFRLSGWRCIAIEPNPTFAALHRARGHEVYEVACGEENRDGVPFELVHSGGSGEHAVTDHSFSALAVKDGYKRHSPYFYDFPVENIVVDLRRLDAILADAQVSEIDLLSVDVEGWEIEVMRGLDVQKYRPRVILLENYLHDAGYIEFMESIGYGLDSKIEYYYVFTDDRRLP